MSNTIGSTDHELVARTALGDVGALAELYDRHARLAYGIALGITRHVGRAEQAVHETFVELWRGLPASDPLRSGIDGWIARAARRRAIDLTRLEPSRKATPAPLAPALRTLGDEERRVVQLAYYGGRSERQIAASLELPIGTIRSRMSSALGTIRGARVVVEPSRPSG
jgi:RNA polymerase sigma-70 factor (ECF subfamily)